MGRAFIDVRKMKKEDWRAIDAIMEEYKIPFNQAMSLYMEMFPDKLRVVAEVDKDMEVVKDVITEDGISEYKGKEALKKMEEDMEEDKE